MERWWESRDPHDVPHEELVEQYRAVCLAVLAEVQERRKRRRALTA